MIANGKMLKTGNWTKKCCTESEERCSRCQHPVGHQQWHIHPITNQMEGQDEANEDEVPGVPEKMVNVQR